MKQVIVWVLFFVVCQLNAQQNNNTQLPLILVNDIEKIALH